jgi:hypothetical protein
MNFTHMSQNDGFHSILNPHAQDYEILPQSFKEDFKLIKASSALNQASDRERRVIENLLRE